VFVVHDIKHNRKVAIKVMHAHLSTPDNQQRFLREIELMQELRHPNIVSVYDNGITTDGRFFMVLQYIHGKELGDILVKHGSIQPKLALSIVTQVASGLHFLHAKGVVHRDIKPQNLIYNRVNKRIYITDFGIAKTFDSEQLTQTGKILGSLYFMPPEQATGETQTAKSDVYSLGAVFYRLVTGLQLYHGETALELVMQHVTRPAPLFPQSHQGLQGLLDAMCAKDPKSRPSAKCVAQIAYKLLKDKEVRGLPLLKLERQTERELEKTAAGGI